MTILRLAFLIDFKELSIIITSVNLDLIFYVRNTDLLKDNLHKRREQYEKEENPLTIR